ncbi:MAG: sigma-70 family RNA polymerase sigma factor [Alphaproteobacteria bacterium]|nr:sigma-70 family RNA polymerase sigma factor [Alphaproteobacteria bacterium]
MNSRNRAGVTGAAGGATGAADPSSPAAAKQPASASDDYLIALAAGGDGAAWSALVERYLAQITGHAWYMLGDPREAEDIAQEAFLRLFAKAPEWQPDGAKLKTWLYRVVVNLCIDRKRKAVPLPIENLPELPDGGAETADRSLDVQRAVRGALDDLPPRQRAALVLTYYQGCSNSEAGEILGISDEAVESLLARGRRALRRDLALLRRDLMG